MKTLKFFLLFLILASCKVEYSYSQLQYCNKYYLTWVGVIDNAEGDDWPHGPEGNLHIQLYDKKGKEISHKILTGPSKNEFLDGDQQGGYCLYLGSSYIYKIKIWESDDDKFKGVEFPGPSSWYGRKHDIMFEGIPKSAGFYYSQKAAKSDAIRNAKKRGASKWLKAKGLWNGTVSSGIPQMFIEIRCSCN